MVYKRNVRDFENDIQAAIDDLPASGGEVYIPAGTYTISSTITMVSNCKLRGAGPSTILQAHDDLDADLISATSKSNITIKDLYLNGSRPTGGGTDTWQNVKFTSCTDCTVTNIKSDNAYGSGVYTLSCTNVLVEGSTFKDNDVDILFRASKYTRAIGNYCEGAVSEAISFFVATGDTPGTGQYGTAVGNTINGGEHGIYAQRVSHINISGNSLFNCTSEGIVVPGDTTTDIPHHINISGNTLDGGCTTGHIVVGTSAKTAEYITISNNVSKDSTGEGVYLQGIANRISIAGNVIEACGSYGIRLASTATNISVKDNIVKGVTQYGIAVFPGSAVNMHLSLVGNHFENNTKQGIYLKYIDYATIVGNQCINNGNDGIFLEICDRAVVTGNTCSDTQGGATQDYGIRSASGSDYNVVTSNVCVGNVTGGISLVGDNNEEGHNITS